MDYDIFISHASEDEEAVARPLALHLQGLGFKVWLDECELTLGDSLRRKIDDGLARSRYGVVILSPAFFAKEWPNKELDGLVAREDGSAKVVLPVWHTLSASEVLRFSPLLAGKVAVSTSRGLAAVAAAVHAAVQRAPEAASDSAATLAAAESASLDRIRRAMLLSDSARDLRRSTYELEAHRARYPHSIEARELDDQLKRALQQAETYDSFAQPGGRPMTSPSAAGPQSAGAFGRWLVVALVVAALVYGALRVLGML
jgi:hypothetical protein